MSRPARRRGRRISAAALDARTIARLWATTPEPIRYRHRRELRLGRPVYPVDQAAGLELLEVDPRSFERPCANPRCRLPVLVAPASGGKRRYCSESCRSIAFDWRSAAAS